MLQYTTLSLKKLSTSTRASKETISAIVNCFYPNRIKRSRQERRYWQNYILTRTASTAATASGNRQNKIALVMGVANERSIAWACVASFLRKGYDCIITYHNPDKNIATNDNINSRYINQQETKTENKYASKIKNLTLSGTPTDVSTSVIECIQCNVETDLPKLFREQIPSVLRRLDIDALDTDPSSSLSNQSNGNRSIDAVVHSVAYAHEMDRSLIQTSLSAYLHAQHISAYSLLETVRECVSNNILSPQGAAITTLSYIGSVRAVPGYGSMGPAKASLESLVRSLALEMGSPETSKNNELNQEIRQRHLQRPTSIVRINAVSAGPIKTVSARGIPNFGSIQSHVEKTAPLRRNVTAGEVAEAVTWLSTSATGVTGQTIYVDAGYSSIVPVV